MEKRFSGKVAIVTGSGRGIGKGIARRMAREGADVVLAEYDANSARAAARELEQLGVRALHYPVDVSDAAAVQSMVGDVIGELGHIDILVNNAGVAQTKPMMKLTEEDWDRVISVNQRGTFFCTQAVARQMIQQIPEELRGEETPADIMTIDSVEKESRGNAESDRASYGKIVNLSSIAGRRGRPLSTHYAASKAAIISITQSAALALAPYNITVNAICPGIVPTPMWEQIDEERGDLFGAKPGEAMSSFINAVPLKRAASPEDIAGAVAFFCSNDANYITGQALNVDGGYEMN
jgi:meso-butanediol dehydrogenase/(S,S)-butanediol dehydrogenase/diacetyl reductase